MARSTPHDQIESESIFDAERFAGLAFASQNHDRVCSRDTERPAGSEFWVSDIGATIHITSDARNVCDWVEIHPEKRQVVIGDGKTMRVVGVGSINLRIYSKTDFDVKLTGVYATEGIGFNLFLLYQAQTQRTIILYKEGAHLCDRQLTFPRDEIESCLCAICLNPTPTAGLTAVPAFSGVTPPPPLPSSGAQPPPSSWSNHPFPFGCLNFCVDGAEPYGFGFEPLSHRRVQGGTAADFSFPPAVSGIVRCDLSFSTPISAVCAEPSVLLTPQPLAEPSPRVEQGAVGIRPLFLTTGMRGPHMRALTDVELTDSHDETNYTEVLPTELNPAAAKALEEVDKYTLLTGIVGTDASVLAPREIALSFYGTPRR